MLGHQQTRRYQAQSTLKEAACSMTDMRLGPSCVLSESSESWPCFAAPEVKRKRGILPGNNNNAASQYHSDLRGRKSNVHGLLIVARSATAHDAVQYDCS